MLRMRLVGKRWVFKLENFGLLFGFPLFLRVFLEKSMHRYFKVSMFFSSISDTWLMSFNFQLEVVSLQTLNMVTLMTYMNEESDIQINKAEGWWEKFSYLNRAHYGSYEVSLLEGSELIKKIILECPLVKYTFSGTSLNFAIFFMTNIVQVYLKFHFFCSCTKYLFIWNSVG
jgi:hypothetical protein